MGAKISFDAYKHKNYNIIKQTNTNTETIANIEETNEKIIIADKNIFNYEEIEYYVVENNEVVSEKIKIRPKDYIINQLNNEIMSGKKKWSV